MYALLLVIFLLVTVILFIRENMFSVVTAVIFVILLVRAFYLWNDISTSYTIDQKIELYEAENSAIESKIEDTVQAIIDIPNER